MKMKFAGKRMYWLELLTAFMLISSSSFGQVDTAGLHNLFDMSLSDLMNQKVVTASKYSQSTAEAASSIGTITSEEIKNYGYQTLGEALNSQRGMYLSNDRNYLYLGSRGFSRPTDYNNRIIIMVDGHILNEIVYGAGTIDNELGINLDNVERIEIVRGPGASVYGSGSMLNIVNLIMKKGAALDGLTASAGIGSFGSRKISASFGKKSGNTDFLFSAVGGLSDGEDFYFSELDSPSTNNGISKGNDWEKYLGLQSIISHNNLKFSALYSDRLKEIPTGAFFTNLTGGSKTCDQRLYLESDYNKKFNEKSNLALKLYYDYYDYSGSYASTGLASNDASTGNWTGAEIQYFLEAGKRNIITAGAEYKVVFQADYREWDSDTTYFNKNFPFSFFSFYGQDQLKLTRKINFTAGFRYDRYSNFGSSFSPRLALTYKYGAASYLKLLYSEAFRIPNIYEGYYESYLSHERNPDIKPEKIKTAELAWSQKMTNSLYGNLSLYYYLIRHLIDQVDQTSGLTTFKNIGSAKCLGVEYEFHYKGLVKGNEAYANISLQNAKDEDTKARLSNSPDLLFKSGVVIRIPHFMQIVPEFFYESGRVTLNGNKTNDVYLLNLGLNSVTFLKHFEASIKVRNILDRKVAYPGGYEHVQDVIPQERRNLSLKLMAHF